LPGFSAEPREAEPGETHAASVQEGLINFVSDHRNARMVRCDPDGRRLTMKRIVRWMLAAGLCLAAGQGAVAAPVSTAAGAMTEAARDNQRALTSEVGYYHRRVYRTRPVHYRRVYRPRPVYYRPVRYRPVYYAAPVYRRPVYYGPRCYTKWRTVYTWQGIVHKPVRRCHY
jgi:hypothetical protein